MARLNSTFTFIGSLGDISAYRVKGSDQIFVRRKGGASKERIKTAPEFENMRRLNAEFGGRSTCASNILNKLHPLRMLAGGKVLTQLNKVLKPIQDADTRSEYGSRNIQISAHPIPLEGFSFNRKHRMESFVAAPIAFELSRENLSAGITLPKLIPGINFLPEDNYPFCSFVISLAVVPDYFYAKDEYRPSSPEYGKIFPMHINTDWFSCGKGMEETTLNLKISATPPDDHYALVLGLGIRFEIVITPGLESSSKSGTAKIMGVV